MPLPKPNDQETEEQFTQRCMSDEAMIAEFPDESQRAAVCHKQWDEAKDEEPDADGKTLSQKLRRMERKFLRKAEFKLTNADEGVWECYASVFRSAPDAYGEIVDKGAFKKTIKENFRRIKNLWNHSVFELIGRPLHLEEDSKGLFARNKLSLGVQRAREVRELMADGALDEVSIGLNTITDRVKDNVRHLVEVRLWDISPVTFAADDEALILSVKGMPADALLELLNIGPDTDQTKLKSAIAALQALLKPDAGKEAGYTTTPPDEDLAAAEALSAIAELQGLADGLDASRVASRIDEMLATI